MSDLDVGLFRWINGWPDALAPFFRFLSEGNKDWGVRIAILALLAFLIFKGGKFRVAGLLAVLAAAVANELTDVLKFAVDSPRPCVELIDVNLYINKLTSSGTASAHAANMAAAAVVLGLVLRKWWWTALSFAFLVGLSRIYVGVHYPSQVLFGWVSGSFVAWLTVWTWRAWEKVEGRRMEDEG